MSSEEKRSWISAIVGVVVPVVYLLVILSRAQETGVADIAYARPLLVSVGVGIVAGIVLAVVAALTSPRGTDRVDERDREINRRGEYAAFYVMSVAAIVPLVLAMAEAEHFWIAHSLYLAFVLASLTASVVKIVAYRRGW